ncbi:MAG: hypothetical protein ACI9SJ_001408 [Flavobacteriaceae bacterium]|jgi:uncharacterized protein (TIGR01777 family)|uniref:TIGR01777 family oxidoreductase n=1 Tax=Candidatus Marifrigoribacter sp. Uisw_064 TaxID=3230970 RepID=UPI003AD902A5
MKSVLITGGSGLIGTTLSNKLLEKGYKVSHLSRSKSNNGQINSYIWDYQTNYIDPASIKTADYIIHLAGAGVADKRWSESQKKVIIESRVKTAELIFEEVKKQNKFIKAYITASGVGYYGSINSEKIAKEEDESHNDFLGNVCLQWEQSAEPFKERGIRTVALRTGLVLSGNGGALSKLVPSFKFGLGSAIGAGTQNVAWIHMNDLCDIYIKAIEDEKMEGAYNTVAPDHVTNMEFSKAIAKVLKKPFWLPKIPGFVLKTILGEMSVILLKGMRVSSKKIIDSGFNFSYPTLNKALIHLLNK